MGNVYSRKLIEGVDVPAVIHNGSYFYIRMGVYEDGTVSCWHKSDIHQFRDDLRKGWVVPSVPDGENISVHGLGEFKIRSGRWLFQEQSFYDHILDVVKTMNPEMSNIYRTSSREVEKWKKHRVSWSGTPTPCKLAGKFGYQLMDGSQVHVFYRKKDGLCLTELNFYADKTLQIEGEEAYYSLEEVKSMFESGVFTTGPSGEEWVRIDGLGETLLAPGCYQVKPMEKYREIEEELKGLAGEEDAHEKCLKAYHQYLVEPGEWSREQLRKAYEAVPEHERIYLGDMDSKDSDFRRILYHPDQKREV